LRRFVVYNETVNRGFDMVSVNRINETLAGLRGMPIANVEAHTRVLRREGVLPETKRGGGATPLCSEDAANILVSLMRGSPSAAAESARQVGQLIVRDDGGSFEGVLQAQLHALGWQEGTTFAQGIGWFIDRFADSTLAKFAEVNQKKPLIIKVDKYKPFAEISWHPPRWIAREYVEAWKKAVAGFDGPPMRTDGTLMDAMSIRFASPLLHQARLSYERGDSAGNREARKRYSDLMEPFSGLDVWGSEHVTARTIGALARLFRYIGCDLKGYPLDPDHPWNRDLPPDERAARIAEIESYITDRTQKEMGASSAD
jgi:hypothetical protein